MDVESMLSAIRIAARRRLEALWRLMEVYGLDAVVLFEGDGVGCRFALTQHFDAVVVTRSEVVVLAGPALYGLAVEESPWRVVLVENLVPAELSRAVMRVVGEGRGLRLGINKMWGRTKVSFLHIDALEALRSVGVEIVDATPLLEQVFSVLMSEELRIVEWLSRAASRALEAVCERLEPGVRECELAAEADRVLDEHGIVDRWFPTMVVSGPRAAAPHAKTSSKRVESGEPVIVDVGPVWMGYDGCVAHTFVVGQSSRWREIVEAVAEALREGLKHARPGTPAKVLNEVPRRVLRDRGLEDYPHLSGHPIAGLYRPVIASFVSYSLEEGMAFAYEPATYIPRQGGARIEPHILITESGPRILTDIHREILTT